MIFPEPFDDELIYSTIARTADRMGLDNIEAISRYVFNRSAVVPSALGVPNIDLLVPRLLPGSTHSGLSLVARHSLIPYYTAFRRHHSTENVAEKLMAGDRSVTIGLSGRIASPLGLRFCERCVAESSSQAQEPFWARSHQLPGVSVCHRHLCSLKEGTTSRSDVRPTFLSLSRVIREAHPTREIAVRAPSHIVEKVALLSHDLLAADLSSRHSDAVADFFGLLADRGWGHQTRQGALSHARLNDRILERLGPDIARDLGIGHSAFTRDVSNGVAADSTRWVYSSMFKKGRVSIPLPYILVLIAIDSGIADLTAARVTPPNAQIERLEVCSNPFCEAYDPSFMKDSQPRTDMAAFDAGCLRCGFVCRWSRMNPNKARRRVIHVGELWDKNLIQECSSGSLPAYRMAKRFGVGCSVMMKRAVELGVWHPRWSDDRLRGAVEAKSKTYEAKRAVTLEKMRIVWLRAKDESPEAGRRELGRSERKAYQFLQRHDPGWLERITPKLKGKAGRKPIPPSPDDTALADRIFEIARDICAREPRTRVTRRLIYRELGRSNPGSSQSAYPQSMAALRAIAAANFRRNGRDRA